MYALSFYGGNGYGLWDVPSNGGGGPVQLSADTTVSTASAFSISIRVGGTFSTNIPSSSSYTSAVWISQDFTTFSNVLSAFSIGHRIPVNLTSNVPNASAFSFGYRISPVLSTAVPHTSAFNFGHKVFGSFNSSAGTSSIGTYSATMDALRAVFQGITSANISSEFSCRKTVNINVSTLINSGTAFGVSSRFILATATAANLADVFHIAKINRFNAITVVGAESQFNGYNPDNALDSVQYAVSSNADLFFNINAAAETSYAVFTSVSSQNQIYTDVVSQFSTNYQGVTKYEYQSNSKTSH